MISCDKHDYIEMVCVFNYMVKLTLKTGEVIEGQAMDTARNTTGEECIKLHVGNEPLLVCLELVNRLEAITKNPHFNEVYLSE